MFNVVKHAHSTNGHLPLHERTTHLVILGHGEERERPKDNHYEHGGDKPYGDTPLPESHIFIIPRASRARNYPLHAFTTRPN